LPSSESRALRHVLNRADVLQSTIPVSGPVTDHVQVLNRVVGHLQPVLVFKVACGPQKFDSEVAQQVSHAACGELWHDQGMIAFAQIVVRLMADVVGLVMLAMTPRRSLQAQNLFLRRELALYRERGIKPRRVDAATRASLAFLSRLFDWRDALVVVRPETLIRWHRAGWRLLWRCKSRPGRPPIPLELRRLIRRMATENPLWGEERIANELLLKLAVRVSPRTVRKYVPKRPPGKPRGDQRWSTFLRNHAKAILACDLNSVSTIPRAYRGLRLCSSVGISSVTVG
jgi:hypothetical protein